MSNQLEKMNFENIVAIISKNVEQARQLDSASLIMGPRESSTSAVHAAIELAAKNLSVTQKTRLVQEFGAEGPLVDLLNDEDVIEIMIVSKNDIWFEKAGGLEKLSEGFLSELTFNNFFHQLCDETKVQTSYKFPFANGFWKNFRVHISAPPITPHPVLTLRRLKQNAIRISDMKNRGWCTESEELAIVQAVQNKKNILVLGNTGSGKTTLINALLAEAASDRSVIIEDTSEIIPANSVSVKMLTRFDCQGQLPEVDQSDLVKQSLRMRPDRLIIGEIRGGEAKDLLLALSTGHRGSISSIHAHSPVEALLRLEMLIQMGAPQWSLESIRRLIHLCVDYLNRDEKREWALDHEWNI